MIFVTVGSQFGFDRLIRVVDRAVEAGLITGEVHAQIGDGHYTPRRFDFVRVMDKMAFDRHVELSSALISHAGMGTLTAALDFNKPILVMPRLKRFGEVVNDHQIETAEEFARHGHVLLARDENELLVNVSALETFSPTPRTVEPDAVVRRISAFLQQTDPRSSRATWGGRYRLPV
jgi:UDP-N-acetylglucosamine transferase subunit ALG13